MNSAFIPESKKLKLIVFLLNSFLVVGILFIPLPESNMPQIPLWLSRLDVILTVIFCVPLTWQLYSFTQNTGLTVSEDGLAENLSTWKTQTFLWNNVVGVKFLKLLSLKYLLIYVQNPDTYIQAQNLFRRLPLKANLKKFGTPVKIPIHTLDKSPQEIAEIISKYIEQLRPKA